MQRPPDRRSRILPAPPRLFIHAAVEKGALKRAAALNLLFAPERRDGRVVEGARLESVFRGNSNEGSNPSLSAILHRPHPATHSTPTYSRRDPGTLPSRRANWF